MKLSIIFLLICSSAVSYALPKTKIQQLSKSSEWINLLHYKKTLFGSIFNSASNDSFFVSKKGRSSSYSELLESIQILNSKDKVKSQDFVCRFPARSLFIKRKLGLPKALSFDACADYLRLKNITNTVGVSIVFTAYHTDAPASTYGHTLLRLEKPSSRPNSKKSALLDYGVNYAALTAENNPILYALKGLFGYYNGHISITPFFYKIREYSDYESRDLWTYHLKFSQEEIDRLVAHLFELENVGFPYYYMTANCSEFMIDLIDIAKPTLHLKKQLDYTTIPSETIKILSKNNLIKSVDFRASTRRKYLESKSQLDKNEIKTFRNLISKQRIESAAKVNNHSEAKILDVALDFIDFKYSDEILRETGEITEFKKLVLLERSNVALKGVSYEKSIPYAERPDLSHDPSKFFLGVGNEDYKGNFLSFTYRHNLHDILDPITGYSPDLSILFFELTAHYYEKEENLELTRMDLLRVSLLRNFDFDNIKPSGQVSIGIKRITAISDLSPYLEISGGFAKDFRFQVGKRIKLYLGLVSGVQGVDVDGESSISIGSHSLLIGRLTTSTLLSFEYKQSQVVAVENSWVRSEYNAQLRHYIMKNLGGSAEISRVDNGGKMITNSSSFGVVYYF